MAAYRVRFFTEDGAVHSERVIECEHDDEAIDQVGESAHPHAIEVWRGARRVAHFPPWRGPI